MQINDCDQNRSRLVSVAVKGEFRFHLVFLFSSRELVDFVLVLTFKLPIGFRLSAKMTV